MPTTTVVPRGACHSYAGEWSAEADRLEGVVRSALGQLLDAFDDFLVRRVRCVDVSVAPNVRA